MMAYIPSLHTAPPHYYSSIRSNRSSYWIGDSDSEIEENTLMSEPRGTRSSRIDRESRDKRSPEKYQRKFKIGDEVEYPKSDLQNKERSRGKIVELCKNNFKKYIVRDAKTYVVYTVHEKDLKLIPKIDVAKNVDNGLKNSPKEVIVTAEDLQRSAQAAADSNRITSIVQNKDIEILNTADTVSTIKEELSSDKVVNERTGHSVTQDIDNVDSKVNRIEKSIRQLQRERVLQYYTNIGLMCALL